MKNRIRLGALLLTMVLFVAGLIAPSASAAPTLVGALNPTPPAVDLTAEGTLDWAHWGLTTVASFDHKAVVPPQISTFAGPGPYAQVAPNGVTYRWIDGIPTLAATTDSGIVALGAGNSFFIKVPADTNLKTLKLYVGVRSAQGRLHVWLSDGSAPDYWDGTLNSNNIVNGVYTIRFAAASAGQELHVQWFTAVDHGLMINSGATLQSATLF